MQKIFYYLGHQVTTEMFTLANTLLTQNKI